MYLQSNDVNQAYIDLAKQFDHTDVSNVREIVSRNGDAKEITPFSYKIENFQNYILDNESRVINLPFALANKSSI